MNYKLAKELKDAGFPQEGEFMWVDTYGKKERWATKNIGMYPSYSFLYIAPTLEELIDACQKFLKGPNNAITIQIYEDKTYVSIGARLCMQRFPKVIEGVAELYLELKRNRQHLNFDKKK